MGVSTSFDMNNIKFSAGASPVEIAQLARMEVSLSENSERLYIRPATASLYYRDIGELADWCSAININPNQTVILLPAGAMNPESLAALTSQSLTISKYVLTSDFSTSKTLLIGSRDNSVALLKEGPRLGSLGTDSKSIEKFAKRSKPEEDSTSLNDVLAGKSATLPKLQYLIQATLDELGFGPGKSRGGTGVRWDNAQKLFTVEIPLEEPIQYDGPKEIAIINTKGEIVQYGDRNLHAVSEINDTHYEATLKAINRLLS